MSLLFADNFQSYGFDESKMLDGVYAQVTGDLAVDPDPNASGNVFSLSNNDLLRFVLAAGAIAAGGVAFRLWLPSLPTSGIRNLFQFRDGGNVTQVSVGVDSTGVAYFYRGDTSAGVALGNSGTPVFTANAWNHIEPKVLISDTVGTAELRINGVAKINLSAIDTKATANVNYAQIQFGNEGVSAEFITCLIKDVAVWSAAGTINNDFLGSVSVFTARPNSDVSFNWTPSSGVVGYSLIDELIPNDAGYISANATPPAASVFSLGDVPVDVTSIKGVVTMARMRKTDGGDCNVQVSMVSNGDIDTGADRPITTAFTYYYDVSELDPDTATVWTPTSINAAQIQVNRTL